MDDTHNYSAFADGKLLANGSKAEVAIAVKRAIERATTNPVLIFDDRTGGQIDLDLRGADEDIVARYEDVGGSSAPQSVGRPKLGVIPREVTLLPRHWDWLARQKGGASAELRRLIDASRKQNGGNAASAEAAAAADRFMIAMTGNLPGYEDAARALYKGDHETFLVATQGWPHDLRDHARKLAAPAFVAEARPQSTADLLVAQFEISWALAAYHLEGLTTEECLWRPAIRCLSVGPDRDGSWRADWPDHEGYDIGPPSVAWTTWHICFWWTKAIGHAQGDCDVTKEDVVWPGDADSVRTTIFDLREKWMALLAGKSADELAAPNPASWPLPESSLSSIAAWLNVELMKNAAEIGLVRFLYAATTEERVPIPAK